MPPPRSGEPDARLTVFYDGACPRCIADRRRYERWTRHAPARIEWLDITRHERKLRHLGIDPRLAMLELHVRTANGVILHGLDAYIALLEIAPRLR